MKVMAFFFTDSLVDWRSAPSFSIIGCTKGSSSSRSTDSPKCWKASMQRSRTRGTWSSRPCKNSGNNWGAIVSLVTVSALSTENCVRAVHAANRTLGCDARNCGWMAPSICKTVASSSTNSTIWAMVVRPATTLFHSPFWKSWAMAALNTSNACGKHSTFAMQRPSLSITSFPFVKLSSSSSSSSSASDHVWTSSLRRSIKLTQTSTVWCR
mmetsp:Transcript_99141/g.280088  ORF Transcript_99141/g.280088 Transcript_99141/m.280088 type:complete len:211 (-) Transcript_99141:1030-1662(-)